MENPEKLPILEHSEENKDILLERESLEARLKSKVHTIFTENRHTPTVREGGEKKEVEYLMDEIKEHDGKLFVMVHPFFEENDRMPDVYAEEIAKNGGLKKRFDECNKKIDMMLADKDRMPMVILEDRRFMDACVRHCLKDSIEMPRDVYLLQTLAGMGTLFLEPPVDTVLPSDVHPRVIEDYRDRISYAGKDDPIRSEAMQFLADRYRYMSWDYLTSIFKVMGVKEVHLGGKYLDIHADEENGGELSLSRCLGEAYDHMSFMVDRKNKEMEIKLSDIVFPYKESDLVGIPTLAERSRKGKEKSE